MQEEERGILGMTVSSLGTSVSASGAWKNPHGGIQGTTREKAAQGEIWESAASRGSRTIRNVELPRESDEGQNCMEHQH